jgi:hypothetical protein
VNAVVTIAIGTHHQEMAAVTHPFMRRYAGRIGADFKAFTKPFVSRSTPHWEKFRIYDVLAAYERVFYVDTDALIMLDCPDIFKVVPRHMLGAFNEGAYFERKHADYFNTGVLVIPRAERDLFARPESQEGDINTFFEQNFINDRIHARNTTVFSLSHKFNKMDFIQAPGHIIHKAGNTNALQELRSLAETILLG